MTQDDERSALLRQHWPSVSASNASGSPSSMSWQNLNATNTEIETSPNVPIILWTVFFLDTSRFLWFTSVVSAYVYLMKGGSAVKLGFLTGINGVVQVIAAVPSSIGADKYRRDTVAKIGSAFGLVAIAVTPVAVYFESFAALCTSAFLYGIHWGITQTCTTALFADSTPDGKRLHYFTQRLIVGRLARTIGPTVGLLIFYFLGDTWTAEECAWVILAAQIVALPSVVLLWFLKDEHSVDENYSDLATSQITQNYKQRSLYRTNYHAAPSSEGSGSSLLLRGASDEEGREEFDILQNFLFFAINLSIFEAMTFLASGLSLKFFPIFFMDNLFLRPSHVQIIYLIVAVGQIPLVHLVKLIADRYGRIWVTAVMCWLGILSLCIMILFYCFIARQNLTINNTLWTCFLFVARMWLMNSSMALRKSALMDAVPKEQRARWGALESLNSATWAGSAFIGGMLVSAHGVLFNFAATCVFQVLAMIPLFFICNEVPFTKKTISLPNQAQAP